MLCSSIDRWYERMNGKCTGQEWSASTSRAPLLVHRSGHVSQFFEEVMFDMAAEGPTPRQLTKYEFTETSLCDWGVIDRLTNKVVMISRIYHRFIEQFCGQNLMFLGIPMLWGGKSIRPDCWRRWGLSLISQCEPPSKYRSPLRLFTRCSSIVLRCPKCQKK